MSQLIKDIKRLDSGTLHKPVQKEHRVVAEELDPEVRKQIFKEVEKPITMEQAYQEASRCLRCYRTSLVITEK